MEKQPHRARGVESAAAHPRRLRRRQALLRWRHYLGWALITAAVFAGPYLIIKTYGWRWWSVLLSFMLVAAFSPVQRYLMPRWTTMARKARGEWLLAAAKTSERAPVLLLRSFSSAVTVEPTPTLKLFGDQRPVNEPTSPSAPKSHLLEIAQHVRSHGPVVAIGTARRGIAMAPRLDVLMFEPDDEVWFQVFEILSAASRAIVMLPGETESVGREYGSLKERELLAKLVIIMPPNGIFLRTWRFRNPLLDDNLDELQAGWTRARKQFETLGVFLPPYDPGGLAFTVGEDGQVREEVPLQGSFVHLERAVKLLVPPETVHCEPLGVAMERLEPFDL